MEELICPLGPGQYTGEGEGGCLRLGSPEADAEVGFGSTKFTPVRGREGSRIWQREKIN